MDRNPEEPMVQDDTLDMGSLLKAIWQTRYTVFYSFLAMAVFLLGLFLILYIFIPGNQTFQSAIQFNFLTKSEEGKIHYPNNVPFSLSDLVAPLVLKKVYNDNRLAEHNIKLKDFIAAVSVSPYALGYNEIIDRYRKKLANKKLTFVEHKEISENMENDLKNNSRDKALIQLHYASYLGLSPEIGRKLAWDIPQAWSDISIKVRGVLKLPQEQGLKILLEKKKMHKLDYPIIYNLLNDKMITLSKNLNELKELDGSETIIDPDSKYSLISLQRSIDDLKTYQIRHIGVLIHKYGLTKDLKLTKFYLEERISEEKIKRNAIFDRTKVLDNILNNENSLVAKDGQEPKSSTASVTPQINEGFLNQMKEMITESLNAPLREKMITEKLLLQKQTIPISNAIARLEKSLSVLRKDQVTSAEIIQDFEKKIDQTINDINTYWGITNNLFKELSNKKFSYSSQLYTKLPLKNNNIYDHVATSRKMLVIYAVLLLFSVFAGLLLGLQQQFKLKKEIS